MKNNIDTLLSLKKQRNAVILSHYYQDPDIQDVADFMGDSLALSQFAQTIKEEVILFCGVHFMCETAKILNPNKIVILPDMDAGCSLADSAPTDAFKQWTLKHPNHIVISYINCTTEIKSMSDIICTSSNAERIINSIPNTQPILFAPDKYLGQYLNQKTRRDMVLWNGACQVHLNFSIKALFKLKIRYPHAKILVHPECDQELLELADHIGSTTSIINYGVTASHDTFIIVTEPGVIYQMQKRAPHKLFIPLPGQDGCACNECPYMRLNTIPKMISALENLEPRIRIDKNLMDKARKPLEKMLELS